MTSQASLAHTLRPRIGRRERRGERWTRAELYSWAVVVAVVVQRSTLCVWFWALSGCWGTFSARWSQQGTVRPWV